jgi:hypothetical protein
MQQKGGKQFTTIQNDNEINRIADDLVKHAILPFFASDDLISIRLTHHRLHFLSQDEYQFNRLLDYIDKGQYDAATRHLAQFPQILNHPRHQKGFMSQCLKQGNVKNIEFLLKTRPKLVREEQHQSYLLNYLLTYGVGANQAAAELLIQANPNLLTLKGPVKDRATGKYFYNISFLQLLIYNLDVRYMWAMVYKNLPQNEEGERIRLELVEQFKEQMKDGVTYELRIGDNQPETEQGKANKNQLIAGFKKLKELGYIDYLLDEENIIIKEHFFDLKPLINALQYYADHYNERDFVACKAFWVPVIGLLQTLLPASIRQHYCDPEEAFEPLPTFKKEQFKRSLVFYNWLSRKDEFFDFSCLGLGLDFGILRSRAWAGVPVAGESKAAADSVALNALFEVRTQIDLAALESQLNQPLFPLVQQNQFGM